MCELISRLDGVSLFLSICVRCVFSRFNFFSCFYFVVVFPENETQTKFEIYKARNHANRLIGIRKSEHEFNILFKCTDLRE